MKKLLFLSLSFLLLCSSIGFAAGKETNRMSTAWKYFQRGLSLSDKGEYDRAIDWYSQAIALNPNLAAAYYIRGVTFGRKGHYDRESTDYSKAIALDQNLREGL